MSYYRRPDGLYEAIRVIDGKRIAFRARKISDLERKIREYKSRDTAVLFAAVADEWWTGHEKTIAYNTAKSYRPAVERAKEEFGKEKISEITPQQIAGYISRFAKQGRSQKNVNTQLQIIRQVFDYAAVNGLVTANPAQPVKSPRGLPRNFRTPPTPAEVKIIKETAKSHLLPALIYYTGARFGEALALRWEDVDFKSKRITINKSVYYVSTTPKIKQPKTAKGTRKVPLLDALEAHLSPQKARGYIFTQDGGKSPLFRSQAERLFKSWQKETGLTITAHQIRHGYATALLEAGIDAKIAQVLLGHAQISTTLDIYTHVRDDFLTTAAAKMDAVF